MRTKMQHCARLDWLLTIFVVGATLLHGFASLSGFAFAQASSSDNATHFAYDNQGARRLGDQAAQMRMNISGHIGH